MKIVCLLQNMTRYEMLMLIHIDTYIHNYFYDAPLLKVYSYG